MSNIPRSFIGCSQSTEKYVIIVKVRIIGRRVKVFTNDNQGFVFQKNAASGRGGGEGRGAFSAQQRFKFTYKKVNDKVGPPHIFGTI